MTIKNWKNKHVCFLGDSITEGVFVTPETTYWGDLEKNVGIISHGFGVNGARMCGAIDQIRRMADSVGENVDAIFILMGTNDFYGNTPMGEWYKLSEEEVVLVKNDDGTPVVKEKRKVRSFDFDGSTFKGNINIVLSQLKMNYPEAQIVLMTPIHRAYACFANDNIQYNELYANAHGLFLEDYVNALKEAANIWATELIDLHSVSGLFPMYDKNASLYFNNTEWDRLHPNAAGHLRIAKVIESKLPTIPLFR